VAELDAQEKVSVDGGNAIVNAFIWFVVSTIDYLEACKESYKEGFNSTANTNC